MDECAVDGCYEPVCDDSADMCEEHEVMAEEEFWPDFHDEGFYGIDDMYTLNGVY